MRRALLLTTLTLIGAMATAAPASAHRSPANCDANQLDVDLIRDRNLVKNGDVINYTVEVDNIGTRACDVSAITIVVQFPAPNGTATGATTTVVTNAGYPAQMPVISFGPFPYTVNANAGVSRLEAKVSVQNGVLHDNVIHSDVNISKTIGSIIPVPGIEVDKAADVKAGLAPQKVTYTFLVYNRTVPAMTLDNVTLTDNLCPNVIGPVAGDDKPRDNRLQPDEVWEYRCTMDHGAGVFNNTATACAELILNGGPMPKVCDTDNETVQFTPPPGPPAPPAPPVPQGGVRGVNAVQQACTLSTPSGLRVRARERTTIRVQTRQVDAGTRVTITLPGGRTVSARTNSRGLAILRVTAPRSGTARIKVAECSAVERLSVRQARRTVSRQVPRVTG
jgi:hypothetical protein